MNDRSGKSSKIIFFRRAACFFERDQTHHFLFSKNIVGNIPNVFRCCLLQTQLAPLVCVHSITNTACSLVVVLRVQTPGASCINNFSHTTPCPNSWCQLHFNLAEHDFITNMNIIETKDVANLKNYTARFL